MRKARIAVVLGMASAATFIAAPGASATIHNLGSFGGGPGYNSSHWDDESYTQIYFDYCQSNQGAPNKSLEIELREDVAGFPDHSWGSKTFTKCFSSFGSNGEWTGLNQGGYFFRINKVDAGAGSGFYIYGNSYVDTTKAD